MNNMAVSPFNSFIISLSADCECCKKSPLHDKPGARQPANCCTLFAPWNSIPYRSCCADLNWLTVPPITIYTSPKRGDLYGVIKYTPSGMQLSKGRLSRHGLSSTCNSLPLGISNTPRVRWGSGSRLRNRVNI